MASRFADMLDRKAEDIKAPPAVPLGHYLFQVKKHPDKEEIKAQSGIVYDRLRFQAVIVSAQEVDEDDLEAFGKVQGIPMRVDFWFNTEDDNKFEGSMDRLKRFLVALGIFEDGIDLSEALAASPGAQFLGEVTHTPDPKDSERIYSEISRTYAV